MKSAIEKHVKWDIGTAYDFFISLWVLHEPEHLGLRGSWAAGVRSRLPAPERELLQRATQIIWPLPWVYSLPKPKDVATALDTLRALPSEQRLMALMPSVHDAIAETWHRVAARGKWNENDLQVMFDEMQHEGWKKEPPAKVRKLAAESLDLWAEHARSADLLISAFDCFHAEFFAEEETRIRPALEASLSNARELSRTTPSWEKLLEVLSQGVRVSTDWEHKEIILVPSYWGTPLPLMADFDTDKLLFLYGARPADQSLIPGELVPDALYQALKALADPSRLRILRYLAGSPMTPTELARRLRLRTPTVLHHLDALRLARLILVNLDADGRRYAVRPEAVESVFELLSQFLTAHEEPGDD